MGYTVQRRHNKPPVNGYTFIPHTCAVCGKNFYPAPFHTYVWVYRRFPRDYDHRVYLCSYKCDLRVDKGEFDECLQTDTMPF